MTAAQRTMLFFLFAKLAKAMSWGPSMRDLKRAELTADVFGEAISCHHNYVSEEHHYGADVLVTRKGAISAKAGAWPCTRT